jgi:hypothetical protein
MNTEIKVYKTSTNYMQINVVFTEIEKDIKSLVDEVTRPDIILSENLYDNIKIDDSILEEAISRIDKQLKNIKLKHNIQNNILTKDDFIKSYNMVYYKILEPIDVIDNKPSSGNEATLNSLFYMYYRNTLRKNIHVEFENSMPIILDEINKIDEENLMRIKKLSEDMKFFIFSASNEKLNNIKLGIIDTVYHGRVFSDTSEFQMVIEPSDNIERI